MSKKKSFLEKFEAIGDLFFLGYEALTIIIIILVIISVVLSIFL